MENPGGNADSAVPLDEKRFELERQRLLLDNSFARKWLPTLVTLMVGLIAAMFSYVQQQESLQATERARIEARAKDEREWGFKVVEMYFSKRDLFDLTRNAENAQLNLSVLAAVAPVSVRGVLAAEQSRIPPPSVGDESTRLGSLAAVAGVQAALASAKQVSQTAPSLLKPSDFTIYVQYGEGARDIATKAQGLLADLGYRVPGIEQVPKAPSRLQVRYYRPDQRSFAGDLATALGKRLELSAGPDNAILVVSSKELPRGILELWLPSRI